MAAGAAAGKGTETMMADKRVTAGSGQRTVIGAASAA